MTIVVGQKFGQRIIILSDTMISDSHSEKHLVIPGRLKATVLDPNLSIAYAGHADQCHDAVLRCHSLLKQGSFNGTILDYLVNESRDTGDGVTKEFMVAVHDDKASLHVIKGGRIGCGNGPYFLGEAKVADRVYKEASVQLEKEPVGFDFKDGEYGSVEESSLKSSFQSLFSNGPKVEEGVGGIPVCLLASPYGHTYDSYSVAMAWNKTISSNPIFASVISEQNERALAGETEWKYGTVSPVTRGVPVVGCYFEQLNLGFIYLPLTSETPFLIKDVDIGSFADTVEWKARELYVAAPT